MKIRREVIRIKNLFYFPLIIILSFYSGNTKLVTKSGFNVNAVENVIHLPKYFYKRMEGSINDNWKIIMNLTRVDTQLTGYLYYKNSGQIIPFTYSSKIDKQGNIYIGEEIEKYNRKYNHIPYGEFKGKFVTENEIKGIWENLDSKNKYHFIFKESYPKGSVHLKLKNFYKQIGTVGKNPSAYITISFPQIIEFNDSLVANSINKSITDSIMKAYDVRDQNNTWKNFNDIMSDFIERFRDFATTDTLYPKNYIPAWSREYTTQTVFNYHNILSLRTIEFSFEGGAHPNTFFTDVSYDLTSGKVIRLDNILHGNYKTLLDKIGEQKLREYYHINSNEDLKKAGLFIHSNQFEMNNNFLITKAGLVFQFNQYEIAPYYMGAPALLIPYSDLKKFIRDKSIIHQFIE